MLSSQSLLCSLPTQQISCEVYAPKWMSQFFSKLSISNSYSLGCTLLSNCLKVAVLKLSRLASQIRDIHITKFFGFLLDFQCKLLKFNTKLHKIKGSNFPYAFNSSLQHFQFLQETLLKNPNSLDTEACCAILLFFIIL